jgi:hypothetical protein
VVYFADILRDRLWRPSAHQRGGRGDARCLTGRQHGATMAGMKWRREPWGGRRGLVTAVVIALAAVALILLSSQ